MAHLDENDSPLICHRCRLSPRQQTKCTPGDKRRSERASCDHWCTNLDVASPVCLLPCFALAPRDAVLSHIQTAFRNSRKPLTRLFPSSAAHVRTRVTDPPRWIFLPCGYVQPLSFPGAAPHTPWTGPQGAEPAETAAVLPFSSSSSRPSGDDVRRPRGRSPAPRL